MKRILAAVLLAAGAGCAGLPSLEGRTPSFVVADTSDTRLAAAVSPLVDAHRGETGIFPLPLATDAFAARVLLAQAAQRSLDAQYYIWHADQTGLLLFEALYDAARRGVRVRLLLDDQNTRGLDGLLASLAATPNIELRLYNPFAQRHARFLDYLGDFERVNRRMHNKAFIVDNHAAVVGGRNIGNEYFGAGQEVPFKDLDVIAIGRAVPEVSAEFDLYWNSASAYPASRVISASGAGEDLALRFASARADPVSSRYIAAVRETPIVGEILARRLAFEWVDAVVVRDDPSKTTQATPSRDVLALAQILEVAGPPQRSFDLISPYFVPGEKGAAALEGLARRGVRIRVLTNSLAGTDVAVVHSGYAKRRCGLARAGIRLYELKPSVAELAGRRKAGSDSSAARLHAKTFSLDGERIFVGSFNFDLRSALLNTEMGLVIHSRVLAQRLAAAFDGFIAENSYEVRALPQGECIEWIEHTATGEVHHETEPDTNAWKRAWLDFLMVLPIDWLL